jgi:dihydroxyacetone synthase
MPPSLEVDEKIFVTLIPTKQNGAGVVSNLHLESTEKHDLVLRYFRTYIADLCEQFKGGHPGYVIIMTLDSEFQHSSSAS